MPVQTAFSVSATRRHSLELFVPQSSIDAHKYFFSRRVVQCWNDLPPCDENFSSLASFKQLLIKLTLGVTHSMVHDNVWFHIYCIESLCVLYLFCVSGFNNLDYT